MEHLSGLRKAYRKLCTEFYDISRPVGCPIEIAFYADILKEVQGELETVLSSESDPHQAQSD